MKIQQILSSIIFASTMTASSLVLAETTSTPAAQMGPEQTKQIQQVVHDYLVSNPQVLVEASQALQQQQLSKMQQKAGTAITKNAKDLFNNSTSPVIGNPNGDVTVVEFMDYQCSHCKEMGPIMDAIISSDSKVRVVYKELPIFGPSSEYAAKAALASQKQGKFAAFHDALFKADGPLSQDVVMKIASSVGLDTAKLGKDLEDPAIAQQLKDNFKLAQELGLMGTPAIVVSNRQGTKNAFVPGTATQENLQQMIAQVRK